MLNTISLNLNKMNFSTMQEQVAENWKEASQLGRKAVLAYVGLVGMAYDVATATWQERNTFFAKAEKRGTKIEKEVLTQVNTLSKDVSETMERLQSNAQKYLRITPPTVSASPAEIAIELAPEATVSAKPVKTAGKASGSSKKSSLPKEMAAVAELVEPLVGYASMNVDTVLRNLRNLSSEALSAVRAYESATKQRVSILRFVDERLQQVQPQPEVSTSEA